MERNERETNSISNEKTTTKTFLRFLNPYISRFKKNNFIPRNRDIYRPIIVPLLVDIKRPLFRSKDSRKKHPRLVSNVISPMVARDEWSNLYDTRDRVAFLAAPLVGVQFLKIVSHAHLDLSIILLNLITVHAFLYALLFFFFFSPTSERRGHLVPDTIIVPRSNFSSRQFFLTVSLLPYTRTARVS